MSLHQGAVDGYWSNARQFLLACMGASLGLGAFWRIPALVAEHGGGAFLLVYLLAVAVVAAPLLVAEWLPARRTHAALPLAYRQLVREAQVASAWCVLPWLQFGAALLALALLCVVAALLLVYLAATLDGSIAVSGTRDAALFYDGMVRAPGRLVVAAALFLVSLVTVSRAGVRGGIERATRVLLPALAVGLFTLWLVAAGSGRLPAGIAAVLVPDFTRLGWDGALAALGQAAVTFTLGVGAMHAYAAYQVIGLPLPRLVGGLVLFDAALTVAAGIAVCALLGADGRTVGSGFTLLFVDLPMLQADADGGRFVAALLLACILVAAWLTGLALLEPLVQWGCARGRHARGAIASAWALLALALATAVLVRLELPAGTAWSGLDMLRLSSDLAAGHLVPLCVLGTALFVAWRLPEGSRRNEMLLVHLPLYRAWLFALRYVAVPALLVVFLHRAGILAAVGSWL